MARVVRSYYFPETDSRARVLQVGYDRFRLYYTDRNNTTNPSTPHTNIEDAEDEMLKLLSKEIGSAIFLGDQAQKLERELAGAREKTLAEKLITNNEPTRRESS